MTQETKHLCYWWCEWLERLARTSYHIVNRKAYRKWRAQRSMRKQLLRESFDACYEPLDQELFH